MINSEFKIDQRFQKSVLARYGRYEIKAGILENKPYRSAKPASKGLGTLLGGPVRKKSYKVKGTVAEVGERIRKQHRVNYLLAPIRKWRSKDMANFRNEFLKFLGGQSKSRSQSETALRAVIRNPILKQQYGRNTRFWARVKTFNRKLFDTGQFYRAIIAKIRVKRV